VDAHTFTKQTSATKLVSSLFWGRRGVMMVELMEQGTTITSEVYCETQKNCVRPFTTKRHGMLTSGIVLLHDNTHLHTAVLTWVLLEHFNWKLFDHPPYSPDLAPSNYHLFIYLKNCLGPQRFNNNEELMEGVKMWLSSQAINFFDTGIQNLFP
jgi:histone-lysine N-methyltransferase SETMAR